MLLALNGVEAGVIRDNYEHGFRGAGKHRGHGLSYDPDTDAWVANHADAWSAAELDEAMSDRLPVMTDWLHETDAEAYLLDAGLDTQTVDRLRSLLRG